MKKLITNSKYRWLASLLLPIVFTSVAFFLTDAMAKQRPQSGKGAAQRKAVTIISAANTFSAPVEMIRPLSPAFFQQGGEPEIKVDVYGNIYLTAIQGVPGGVDLWKSIDKGGTFVYLGQPDGAQDKCPTIPQCAGAGGGDDQIDVSPGGYLYVSSLWLGNVTMSTSYDGGTGGALPGQKWEVNPAAANIVSDDRQWVAAYGPQTVYMSFATTALTRPPGSVGLFITKSTDGGKTFPSLVEITATTPLDTVNVEGNLVVDPYNGNLYTAYIPNGSPNVIKFAHSTDGGATWVITDAYTGVAGTTNRGVFPIVAVDRGGNVHLVFTNSAAAGHTNCHVLMTSTANPSTASPSWLSAVQVDSGTGNSTTSVQPWVVAGSPGVVDVTWLGSSAPSPDVPSDWQVFFAQTTNALSGSPIFNQSQVTTNRIHDNIICFSGAGCAAGTRDMLEYYTMALDPDGNANIAFPDSVNNCPSASCKTNAWFIKQTGGNSAYAPPAPPASSTFVNLAIPNSGGTAEPNGKVDSHNCIMGGSIGGPIDFISQNAGASFTTRTVIVGTGVHGGDFEIAPLPQASGARPDQIYTADLGITSVHIGKSTDGGATYFQPGTGGAAGEVSVSSDRMWFAPDRGAPTAPDQTLYLMDHEFVSEAVRFSALTNDTAWSAFADGMTDPELILPPTSTFPNTNPGPTFVDKTSHNVFGFFNASTITTNQANPPFGKMPAVWEAVGPAPAAAGAPPGPFTNHLVFKGVIDSPTNPAPPAGTATFGSNASNDFPSAAIDSAGNVYAVWAMNDARLNHFNIWFAASHDHGQNFYGPFQVSSGPGHALMPWIAGGDNGKVDIVFYQTTDTQDPNTTTTDKWHVMFAQSANAADREPVFTTSEAGDHLNHVGPICNQGLLCGSGTRNLLDFFNVAIGPDGLANIMYADDGLSGLHISYARQTSGPLALNNPSSVTCLPCPATPVSVVSRKTHGTVGDFDIDLLGAPGGLGIECRIGQGPNSNNHQVIFSFPCPITFTSATVSGQKGTPGVSSVNVNGSVVTVNLTGIANEQTITITLVNVNGVGNVSVPMGVLLGDTTANRFVNSGDVSQTQSQSGQPLTGSNFREDVTANGFINSADVSLVQSKSGTSLP